MFNHSSASASTPAPEFFSLEPAANTPGTPVSVATSSVIVRTPQELGGAGGFPPTPQWSATGTPTGYSAYNFPFFFPPAEFNFVQFPPSTESCSTGTSNLQSPILQGGPLDLGHGLNQLNRFPNYGRGVGLPYSDLGGLSMGSQKQHKGGRRPREEMTRNGELDDPEEADKKLKRRQRNKEAAARCRQRRLDLMEQLQSHVDRLKGENDGKEREIKNMSDKLNRLVDFIRKHQCNLSDDDKNSLDSILASAGTSNYVSNSGNGHSHQYDRGSVSSGSSVSIISDYALQNPPVSRPSLGPPSHPAPKRHYPTSMPPTSAPDDLEPDTKLGKMLAAQSEQERALENVLATVAAPANVKEELLDPETDKSWFSRGMRSRVPVRQFRREFRRRSLSVDRLNKRNTKIHRDNFTFEHGFNLRQNTNYSEDVISDKNVTLFQSNMLERPNNLFNLMDFREIISNSNNSCSFYSPPDVHNYDESLFKTSAISEWVQNSHHGIECPIPERPTSFQSMPMFGTTCHQNLNMSLFVDTGKMEQLASDLSTPLKNSPQLVFGGPNSAFGTPVRPCSGDISELYSSMQSLQLSQTPVLDISILHPRLENNRNPTLAEVNSDLSRPNMLMGAAFTSANTMPITTPSREIMSSMPTGLHGTTPAFDIFGNRDCLLGNQSTGLTPSVQPNINFVNVMQTPTPLAQDGDYRTL